VNGTTATVTYTPATAGNLEDSFTFKVTDPHGGIGQAVVQINPPAEPTTPPPPVDTVVAFDAAVEALSGQPVTITLQGNAPDGTDLTFSIVEPPASGAVSTPVPVPGSPARMATVTYQSSPGFVGADAFRFEACGIIGEATVCAQATVTVQVSELQTVVAQDQEVTTRENVLVQITLGAVSSLGGASEVRLGARSALVTEVIDRGAAVAGSVADSTDPRDGLGDNHTDLPGPAPVLVAAAVDATGGPGSNGTIRIQMEWEVASLGLQPLSVASAEVLLHTVKGTVDALDTFFLAGTGEQDGLLADADFQAPATAIPGAVMPVPDGPAGSEGTFAFDVTAPLQRALALDRSHFSIQGRVNEALTGFQRGLQVRTTATGNLTDQLEPRLRISLAEGAPEFVFTIVTLPAHGTLLDSTSTPITTVPAILPSRTLTFVPTPAFNGLDEFIFSASDGVTVDQALVELVIQPAVGPGGPGGSGGDCEVDPDGCDNGR
jgi:hypothetical protein